MAYVPKLTQTPNASQQNNNDSGDTRMTEGTVEEEKKCTQPDRTRGHAVKKTKRVNWKKNEDN